ncbi:hypothetical protein ACROYT_G008453 [Oculina patagonica]
MSAVEQNWQTTRPTIRERSKFMFNNELFSDVKFVVRSANGENDSKRSKHVIPAHKFVLSISSPVFEAMFYSELAETGDSIELPDGEYESLLELFRYMYSNEVSLSGCNVMGVLYLAKKYMVPSLADKCTEYLKDNLNPSNVFSILPSAQKYEEKTLVDRCWEVIDVQTGEAVKSDAFATIERSLLEAVVERDSLCTNEVNLFKAVNLWATKECERQGLTADGEVKRRILGESIVKGIRFPIMKETEFANVVLDSKILTPEEVVSFFKFYNSALDAPMEFVESVRSGFRKENIHRCARFRSVEEVSEDRGWHYPGDIEDRIDFTVDKDIMLRGLCLFGSENNDHSVTLTIKKNGRNSAVVSKTGTFPSKLFQYKTSSFHGFEVLFDSAVKLNKATRYQVEAIITGPHSWVGRDGITTVFCSGVTFRLKNSTSIFTNGTDTKRGQFPEILFSVLT